MEIFKIKLTPRVKERDWEVRHITSNRISKKCEICGGTMDIRHSSTSFTKRTTKGNKTKYETHHCCIHLPGSVDQCTTKLAEKLGITNLEECWVN